ncbi:MAG: protein translocase subunit SecF [Gammaproteobacteria bacterium CG_4_10_14_0_8_um_filter_38_16]|nr:MAG: protein translocase subunit SecF [Gammaproteobacteria bacterium CG_4_10_14_0_8_um_filter_38_16]PJA03117.1 MAG: protein translocase subunit SecF [Gammaproteobacteria bacterium CG_4_10_14_0_2_um_filter_38_22]PJB10374.1 MAG: protein translocase subunit SecF [Gammaproteobacteria bacterium CG_4_9_14_3_um_filter_38_9]
MEFFKAKPNIPFMKQRWLAATISAIIFICSIVSLCWHGLNLGLDFTGGTQAEVTFMQTVDVNQLREQLVKAGFHQAIVQVYAQTALSGKTKDAYSVRVGLHKSLTQEQLKDKLVQAMPGAQINSLEYIGPQVGKQLMTNGILAVVLAFVGTMIYIALRFEYRFALSAALALVHDPVLILGVFSFFHLEFNLIVLTALLTVIGYSLNDTIVVYDRVRENFRKIRKGTPLEIMDLSINQTLSRTIMTSGLTLVVVVALFLYGGQSVHEFALAMMIGIVVGTYSSIYVAGSLAIAFGLTRSNLIPAQKVVDELP